MNIKTLRYCCFILLLASALASCSGNKLALKLVGNALSSTASGTALTGDDDPELVGDALPFALKLYEILIEKGSDNPGLYLAAGSGFIMYSNAFVQGPAELLPDQEFEKKEKMIVRSKKLYLRGRDYVLQGIELKHSGFAKSLDNGTLHDLLASMKADDVPYLYWAGAGWMAAYAADPFDVGVGVGVRNAAAMMEAALGLDEAFGGGSIHEFFISYYGSLPQSMGGSEEKARHHFKRAVELSKGLKASPYVALASTVSVKNQNMKEFVELLNRALAVDVSEKTDTRLANILAQRKARWLLEHRDDRILSDTPKGVKKK
ncbi:MAG TPA: TRAP transporter TatT component family protein [Spirochaetota bacterium]|nr:TRAP transporter TatT component family protein [Spirochaetota bacterium]HOD13805.1 TRAP transporter TatT component family protein [Spirochaetota bacterium]HPG50142.1 TRAP transporter TatT component family protein [Spirochaetota bacterium]HPN11579.1 TRAP transporter TatT component family protein [Spirochaetota bacterium]